VVAAARCEVKYRPAGIVVHIVVLFVVSEAALALMSGLARLVLAAMLRLWPGLLDGKKPRPMITDAPSVRHWPDSRWPPVTPLYRVSTVLL